MKRAMIVVVLSGASTGCPQPQASMPTGCPAGVDANGYCVDNRRELPALYRAETVATEKAIDGFDIEAHPAGAAGWKIRITSKIDTVASVVWDESLFVSSDGRAMGRLIVGETKRMDIAKAHPNLPVAPGSAVVQFVVVEKLADQEDFEIEAAEKYPRLEPDQFARLEKLRATRTAVIVGGKLYVTVQSAAGKQTWTGVVVAPAAGSE